MFYFNLRRALAPSVHLVHSYCVSLFLLSLLPPPFPTPSSSTYNTSSYTKEATENGRCELPPTYAAPPQFPVHGAGGRANDRTSPPTVKAETTVIEVRDACSRW